MSIVEHAFLSIGSALRNSAILRRAFRTDQRVLYSKKWLQTPNVNSIACLRICQQILDKFVVVIKCDFVWRAPATVKPVLNQDRPGLIQYLFDRSQIFVG